MILAPRRLTRDCLKAQTYVSRGRRCLSREGGKAIPLWSSPLRRLLISPNQLDNLDTPFSAPFPTKTNFVPIRLELSFHGPVWRSSFWRWCAILSFGMLHCSTISVLVAPFASPANSYTLISSPFTNYYI